MPTCLGLYSLLPSSTFFAPSSCPLKGLEKSYGRDGQWGNQQTPGDASAKVYLQTRLNPISTQPNVVSMPLNSLTGCILLTISGVKIIPLSGHAVVCSQ